MQLATIFALTVGAVAVVHFIDLAQERIRSAARPGPDAPRRGWYCFFSPDDLHWEDRRTISRERQDQRAAQDIDRRNRRRQQEQHRPQLRL